MSENKAILIFIILVISAVIIAVLGIMPNIRKAAKLFKDDSSSDDENDENIHNNDRQ